MSTSLWNIGTEFNALNEMLEGDQGEITESHEQLEKEVMNLLSSKIDGCVAFVDMNKDLIKLAKEKKKELDAFIKTKTNAIETFEKYAIQCLQNTDSKALVGSLNEIKLRKPSKVLELISEEKNLIPVEFIEEVTTIKIDKSGLKKALKAGEIKEEGFRIVDGKQSVTFGLRKGK